MILVPPVIGLHPLLYDGLVYVAEALAGRGHRTTIISFPGQSGNDGVFSVARSCEQLSAFMNGAKRPFLLFGICTGALAALATASTNRLARGVFCWDLATQIDYSEAAVQSLTERYGIRFCQASALIPVQPADFVKSVTVPIAFAAPVRSLYTRPALQRGLASAAAEGKAFNVERTGHFPGVPRGSERILADVIAQWAADRQPTPCRSSPLGIERHA